MKKLLIGFICLSMFACQSENKNQKQADSASNNNHTSVNDTLNYAYDSVKVVSKNIVTADDRLKDTTRAVITFPKFEDSTLNELVERRVCNNAATPDRSYKTYAELANSFIKGFDDYLSYNEDNIQTWFLDVNVNVIDQDASLLVMKFAQADYMGGAHPNSSISYLNYDRQKKAVLTLDDILKPNTYKRLEAIAEQIFRKNEGLNPTQSLANVYFFDKDVFHLNSNFMLTNEGIEFLYNPYEIKAYAAGRTKLLVPYASIQDLILENSIIHRITNNAGI